MADSPHKPGRTLKRLGLVLIVVGVVLGVASGIAGGAKVGRSYLDALTGTVYTAPAQTTVELKQARYDIMQDVGSGLRFSGGRTDIDPGSVQVTGPGGVQPEVTYSVSSLTIDRDNDLFQAAVEFSAPVAGQYQITVTAPSGANFIVARDVAQSFTDAGGWFALTGLGVLAFIAGLVLLLVGFGRHRQGTPPALIQFGAQQYQPGQPLQPYQPAAPAQLPPPGWYQDPGNPGGTRYWDGRRWLP